MTYPTHFYSVLGIGKIKVVGRLLDVKKICVLHIELTQPGAVPAQSAFSEKYKKSSKIIIIFTRINFFLFLFTPIPLKENALEKQIICCLLLRRSL